MANILCILIPGGAVGVVIGARGGAGVGLSLDCVLR